MLGWFKLYFKLGDKYGGRNILTDFITDLKGYRKKLEKIPPIQKFV